MRVAPQDLRRVVHVHVCAQARPLDNPSFHADGSHLFAYSSNGLSHCKEEDTPEPYLENTIRAYLRLVQKAVAHVGRQA